MQIGIILPFTILRHRPWMRWMTVKRWKDIMPTITTLIPITNAELFVPRTPMRGSIFCWHCWGLFMNVSWICRKPFNMQFVSKPNQPAIYLDDFNLNFSDFHSIFTSFPGLVFVFLPKFIRFICGIALCRRVWSVTELNSTFPLYF